MLNLLAQEAPRKELQAVDARRRPPGPVRRLRGKTLRSTVELKPTSPLVHTSPPGKTAAMLKRSFIDASPGMDDELIKSAAKT